ncbi:MAG TPA: TetR-like C-terminal domain-containing protein [Clostridia bacterium]|nr:TetR-like C-terminal domain-containing protein [Clostridia bacterium]
MPAPARTSLDAIVTAGRAILDADSLEGLTMDRVAAAVGVRGPSLYKRVRDRGELVHLIANRIALDLGDRIEAAASSGDPRRDLRSMIDAFRRFAHDQPASYGLLFDRLPDAWRADRDLVERAVEPLFVAVRALAGPDDALEAARTVVAWARGFIDMELAGAFKLGGDVERAYAFGADRVIAAIAARPSTGRA